MNIYDIIERKRHGKELSDEEIKFFVDGFTHGEIPDYQASALLMAICINSMTDRETSALTYAMAYSGDTVDLSCLGDMTADKHSTGGVGDKTSLIVIPIVCSCGVKMAKMSGRGLGHTGGTIDKLESIPGYRTELAKEEFFSVVDHVGAALISQTGNITPADKKLYALRDVTATVDSIPLIASSIMSKKIAAGASSIVLDVKVGTGAFMRDINSARELAKVMTAIGRNCGRRVSALITNMDLPLGHAVGNSLEVIEAIDVLRGNGPNDLREVSIELSAAILRLCFGYDHDKAYIEATEALDSGRAFSKFKEWIGAQGGDVSLIDDTSSFPKAMYSVDVCAGISGYVHEMNTSLIGRIACDLGAGRHKKDDVIDHSAGIVILKKTSNVVTKGETLATFYTNDRSKLEDAKQSYLEAVCIRSDPIPKPKLIFDII